MSVAKVGGYRWVVLVAYMWGAAVSQLLWLDFAPVTPLVENLFHVSEFEVGLLSMVFPLLYIPISIPSGILTDSKGYRVSVGIGVIFMAIFSVLRIFSQDFTMLLLFQACTAIGQPFVMNSISKLAATWFPRKERVLATGLGSMALLLGMMISLSVTPFLTLSYGFQSMLLAYSAIAVIGAAFFLIVARGKPATAVEPDEVSEAFSGKAFRGVVRSRDIGLLSAAFFIGVGLFTALATWLEKILEPFGISITDAGIVGGIFIMGGIIGSIVIPVLSDKTGRRRPFLVGDLLISAAALMIFFTGGSFLFILACAFALGFFLMPSLPIGLQVSAELVGSSMAGTAASVLWFFSQIGSVVFIALMESVKTTFGSFQYSILVLVALDIAAALLCSRISETGKRMQTATYQ
jgi:sugar phosphate permease